MSKPTMEIVHPRLGPCTINVSDWEAMKAQGATLPGEEAAEGEPSEPQGNEKPVTEATGTEPGATATEGAEGTGEGEGATAED